MAQTELTITVIFSYSVNKTLDANKESKIEATAYS
jgi:hypothetical protein